MGHWQWKKSGKRILRKAATDWGGAEVKHTTDTSSSSTRQAWARTTVHIWCSYVYCVKDHKQLDKTFVLEVEFDDVLEGFPVFLSEGRGNTSYEEKVCWVNWASIVEAWSTHRTFFKQEQAVTKLMEPHHLTAHPESCQRAVHTAPKDSHVDVEHPRLVELYLVKDVVRLQVATGC